MVSYHPALAPFFGVYKGFTPSDNSRVGFGEIKLTFSRRRVRTDIATGTELQRRFVSMQEIEPLPIEKMKRLLEPYDLDASKFTGFRYDRGPSFLFRTSHRLLQPDLLRFAAFSSLFGPDELYGPTPVRHRVLDVRTFPQRLMGMSKVVPRIRYDGLSQSDYLRR